MPKPVHPFTQHAARWAEALKNLPTAHESAKDSAVGYIRTQVTTAAVRAKMNPADVGTFWFRQRPHIHISPGETADKEYGTLTDAPQATIRNAAGRADREAARIYHRHLQQGLDI